MFEENFLIKKKFLSEKNCIKNLMSRENVSITKIDKMV